MKIDRREFLTMTSLGFGAALVAAACGSTEQTWHQLSFTPKFSGEITRLALISDATALALQDRTLPDLMRRALMGTPGLTSILGMGILFPTGDSVISFLAEAQPSWFDSDTDDDHRVAIATGYLMHRAAERRIREGMIAAGISTAEVDSAKLQQDAEVIRRFLSNSPQTKAEAEALLLVLDQRLRIQIHTLRPDGTDEKAWVMQLLEWDALQESLFKQLAATIAEPDAQKYFRYVEALNFFDSASPLINAARKQNSTEPLVKKTKETCLYELALEDCRKVVTLVSQFIEGSTNAKSLVQQLN